MMIKGQPLRVYLAEHPDLCVLIGVVILAGIALIVTMGERV